MTKRSIAIITSVLLSLSSCKVSMSPQKYVKWFESQRSQYRHTIHRNGIDVSVTYLPREYLAARDYCFRGDSAIDHYRDMYASSHTFILELSSDMIRRGSYLLLKDGNKLFADNVTRNSFSRNDDIFLLCGLDTIKLSDYYYERNWDFNNTDVFTLGFSSSKKCSMLSGYDLYIRNFSNQLGTIVLPLKSVFKHYAELKG